MPNCRNCNQPADAVRYLFTNESVIAIYKHGTEEHRHQTQLLNADRLCREDRGEKLESGIDRRRVL